jgi:hypothetical protein
MEKNNKPKIKKLKALENHITPILQKLKAIFREGSADKIPSDFLEFKMK